MYAFPTPLPSPSITVTDQDVERLDDLLARHGCATAEKLDAELARANVVTQREVAHDVVTMNSTVIYEDLGTGVRRTVHVVYPRDADGARGFV